MLYMFRTVLVHHQEQLYKLAVPHIWYMPVYAGNIRLAVVSIAMQQPDVWYRHIPNSMYSL